MGLGWEQKGLSFFVVFDLCGVGAGVVWWGGGAGGKGGGVGGLVGSG